MSDRVLFTRLCSSPVALATEAFTRSPIVSGVSFIAGLFAITSTSWVSASNIFSVLASVGRLEERSVGKECVRVDLGGRRIIKEKKKQQCSSNIRISKLHS